MLTPKPDTDPMFVTFVTQSIGFTDSVMRESVGVVYPAVAEGRFAVLPVPVPPLAEQRAIAAYLDRATAALDRAIERTRLQIERVEEYRMRLVADVVTGKLDCSGGRRCRAPRISLTGRPEPEPAILVTQ